MMDFTDGSAANAEASEESSDPKSEGSSSNSFQTAKTTANATQPEPAASGAEWKVAGTESVVEGGNATYVLSFTGDVPGSGQWQSVQIEMLFGNSGSFPPVESADFTTRFADAVKQAAPGGFTVKGDGNGPLTVTITSEAQQTDFSFTLQTYDDGHVEPVEDYSIVLFDASSSDGVSPVDIAPTFREAPTRLLDNDTKQELSEQDSTDDGQGESAVAKLDAIDNAVTQTFSVAAGKQIQLPADFQLAAVLVSGNDLVLRGVDGSLIIVSDGVRDVPAIQTAAGIQISADVLATAISAADTQTAEGNENADKAPPSSGGNFITPPGEIGDPFDISELLPPTAFGREFIDQVEYAGILVEEFEPPEAIPVPPEITSLPTALTVEESDLDGIGSTPSETGETDISVITIAAGPSTVNQIGFSPTQPGIQVAGLDLGLSEPIVWQVDSVGNLVGTVDGTPVIQISATLNGDIPAEQTGTATIEVELLGPLQNMLGDGDIVVSNVSFFVEDTNALTATSTTSVTVIDDSPVATNDGNLDTLAEDISGQLIGTVADLTGDDSYGADGENATTPIAIAAGNQGGSVIINGSNLEYTNTTANVADGATLIETFTYTITDGDGDSAEATFTVTLTDTGVSGVSASNVSVDEDDLPTIGNNDSATGDLATPVPAGTLNYTLGEDGLGSITLDTTSNATGLTTIAGDDVVTIWNAGTNTLIGYVSGTDPADTANHVFTIAVTGATSNTNAANSATYTTTLLKPVTHLGTNPGEEDDVTFTVNVTVEDADGSTQNTTFDVLIDDDIPVATNDGNLDTLAEDISGQLIGTVADLTGDDSYGADGENATTPIAIAAGNQGGSVIINGSNLEYTNTTANVADGATLIETFTYTITDGDGDSAEATFTVTLTDTGVSGVSASNVSVDEDDLPTIGNNDSATGDLATPVPAGTLNYTLGEDGLGSITLDTTSNATGLTTIAGDDVVTIWNAGTNTLIGYVSGTDPADTANHVFTIAVTGATSNTNAANSATYTTTLLKPVTHLGTNPGEEDDVTFTVNVTVEDADGSTQNTTFDVLIDDDIPVATNDGNLDTLAEDISGQLIGTVADLTGDDSYGADGENATTPIAIAAGNQGGSVIINGSNLEYTNTTANVADGATLIETFTYTITDGDGDSAEATFTVTLTDTGVSGVSASNVSVDEDDLPTIGNNDSATGDLATPVPAGTLNYTLGEDGLGSITLDTTSNATGLTTIAGDDVVTIWNAGTNTLIGYVSGTDPADTANHVFTIAVTGATSNTNAANSATYTTTLLKPVTHLGTNPGEEDDVTFTVNVTVEDADGSTQNTTFDVLIDDDVPVSFSPEAITLVNLSSSPGIESGIGVISVESGGPVGQNAVETGDGDLILIGDQTPSPNLPFHDVSIFLDENDIFNPGADNQIDALHVLGENRFLFSTNSGDVSDPNVTPGTGQTDIFLYDNGTITAANAADFAGVDFTGESSFANSDAIDGLHLLDDNSIILSATEANHTLDGVNFDGNDLIHWDGTTAIKVFDADNNANSGALRGLVGAMLFTGAFDPAGPTQAGSLQINTVDPNITALNVIDSTTDGSGNVVLTHFTIAFGGDVQLSGTNSFIEDPSDKFNSTQLLEVRLDDAGNYWVNALPVFDTGEQGERDGDEIDAASVTVADSNSGTTTATGQLDTDGDIDNNVGADQVGTITFADLNPADDYLYNAAGTELVTSGGENIVLSGFGTDTLVGITETSGVTVLTVTLNPDGVIGGNDLYTVELEQLLDDGSGLSLVGVGVSDAGNSPFARITGPVDAQGETQDLLFSAVAPDGTESTINTDSTDISVSSQGAGTRDGEIIRIDFVTDLSIGSQGGDTFFDFANRYGGNGFQFAINAVGNSGSTEIVLKAFTSTAADPAGTNETTHFNSLTSSRTQETITEILVNGTALTLSDGATTTISGTTYTVGISGADIIVEGLEAEDVVAVRTANGYNQIEIENLDDGGGPSDGFSVDSFQLLSTTAGASFDISFDLQLADADGDVSDGSIDITVLPNGSTIDGTANADTLFGGGGDDIINGLAGNDRIIGGLGADDIDGGPDNDTADYSLSSGAVTINLALDTYSGGDAQGDDLDSIENVIGSSLGDTLTGDLSANILSGGAGNDLLTGNGGVDTLTGGTGLDTFNLDLSTLSAADVISDYVLGEDIVDLTELFIADIGGADPDTDQLSDFVQVVQNGNGTPDELQVDADGGADGFVTVATLNANSGVTIVFNDDGADTSSTVI